MIQPNLMLCPQPHLTIKSLVPKVVIDVEKARRGFTPRFNSSGSLVLGAMKMSKQSLTPIPYKNYTITQRSQDGYLNATEMCKAVDKRLNNYLRNETTQAFLSALESDTRIRASVLVQVIKGGRADTQGTWVHPKVAMHLAQWASPEFAVWCANIIFNYITCQTAKPVKPALVRKPKKQAALPPELIWIAASNFTASSGAILADHFPDEVARMDAFIEEQFIEHMPVEHKEFLSTYRFIYPTNPRAWVKLHQYLELEKRKVA